MSRWTKEQIAERAGRILKIIELAGSPGMDEVAVKLNSGLTYREKEEASRWQQAFELASSEDESVFNLALQLYERSR